MAIWQKPRPEQVTYVVGDIHGCMDALTELMGLIDEDIAASNLDAPKVVFVGDYVDRGYASREVLSTVHGMTRDYSDFVVALGGNHEDLLLEFLDDPLGRGRRWLKFGGRATLESFGLGDALSGSDRLGSELADIAAMLTEAIGPELLQWIRDRPSFWGTGNLWVTHAGGDPDVAIQNQTAETLRWGHENFMTTDRPDGQWVAFGHTPIDKPFARNGRIAVDTGAVYGGKLTAARITPDGDTTFLSTE